MKTKLFFLLALLVFATSGQCIEKELKYFDYGKVANGTYYNSFFNLELKLPKEWIVKTQKENQELIELGKELIVESNQELEKLIELSEVNSAVLLSLFRYPDDVVVQFNPSMMLMVENLNNFPNISETFYLSNVRTLLQQTEMYSNIQETTSVEKVIGKDFHILSAEINYGIFIIKQRYYTIFHNGFALSFIATFVDKADEETIMNALKSLKF